MLNLVICPNNLYLTVATDDKEAIDESNIIEGDRLRHAKPATGQYQEKEEDDFAQEAQ